MVARYGGEEFVVLLPATGADETLEVAERLRRAIAGQVWPRRRVTASMGIGTIGPRTAGAAALVEQADRALYRSKEAGRNRATHYRSCELLPVEADTHLG